MSALPSINTQKAPRSKWSLSTGFMFSVASLLLVVWISGWAVSPHGDHRAINTFGGKLAFIVLFVGGPSYVYIRLSKPVGFALLAGSWVMWTLGVNSLLDW